MAPIRLGNGTSISDIRLGDGTGINQVRKGDGTVLWSALPDSGIARYEFEQDVTDSWGPHDGTDDTSAGYGNGTVGSYAKALDGVDDVVDFGQPSSLNPASVSVACWVNADALDASSTNRIFFAGDSYGLQHTLDNNWGFFTRVSSGYYNTNSTTNMTTGSWVHLCGTYDGSQMALYIDGASEDTNTTLSGDIGSFLGNVTIGAKADGSEFFDGLVDDARVYDKALTSTEVSNLHSTGSISG